MEIKEWKCMHLWFIGRIKNEFCEKMLILSGVSWPEWREAWSVSITIYGQSHSIEAIYRRKVANLAAVSIYAQFFVSKKGCITALRLTHMLSCCFEWVQSVLQSWPTASCVDALTIVNSASKFCECKKALGCFFFGFRYWKKFS